MSERYQSISNWQLGFMMATNPSMLAKPEIIDNCRADPSLMFWEIWMDWYAPEFKIRHIYHQTVVKGRKLNVRGF
jgi:hypothetical protein